MGIKEKMTKQPPVPMSKDEINALISATTDSDYYYTLFNFAKKTGRRLGEYYDLKVKDIRFDEGTVLMKVLKRRKRVEKEVIIDDEILRLLKRFVEIEKLKLDDYVFHKYSYRQIQRKIKLYAVKAGIKKNVMFHNFRHYFVTGLIKQGWTYDQIMKLTGHASISTLTVYDSATARDIEDKARSSIKNL